MDAKASEFIGRKPDERCRHGAGHQRRRRGLAGPGRPRAWRRRSGPADRGRSAGRRPERDVGRRRPPSARRGPRPAGGDRRVDEPGFDDLVSFSVDGPPALAVLGARLGELGGPASEASVVASGVNLGQNTGIAVLFSGTVGAALAASNLGLSALAVSINSFTPCHLDTATIVAAAALDWILDAPAGTVLNVNVPDLAVDRLLGVRQAPLATIGAVQASVHERGPGPYNAHFRVTQPEPEPGTDGALLNEGWVTVSALVGIRATGANDVAATIQLAISRAA